MLAELQKNHNNFVIYNQCIKFASDLETVVFVGW